MAVKAEIACGIQGWRAIGLPGGESAGPLDGQKRAD